MDNITEDVSSNIRNKLVKKKKLKKRKNQLTSNTLVSGNINSVSPTNETIQITRYGHSIIETKQQQNGNKKGALDCIDNFPGPVWSVRYRDPCITLSSDRLTAIGFKGWSTILLTHGANYGCWYFEITIEKGIPLALPNLANPFIQSSSKPQLNMKHNLLTVPTPHIRIGWSCRYSRFDLPIGYDKFGVCLRDVDGSIITQAKRHRYANKMINEGVVIGCGIVLGYSSSHICDPRSKPELHPFLESGLLCDPSRQPQAIPNNGSSIEFTINGTSLGPVMTLMHSGRYHPAVSLYMGSQCRINIGPEFQYSPPALSVNAQQLTGFSIYHPASRLTRPDF